MVEKSSKTIFIGKLLNSFGLLFPTFCSTILIKAISHPRKGRLKDFQEKYLEKNTNYFSIDKQENIPYYIWKNTEHKPINVLLCHGWESNTHRWKKFVSYMKDSDFRFISLDAPGHGRSDSNEFTMVKYGEYIMAMIEAFKPKYVVAHSVGSFCALYALSKLPQYSSIRIICLSGPHSAMFVMERVFYLLDLNERMKRAFLKTIEQKFNVSMAEVDISHVGQFVQNYGVLIYDKTDFVNPIECGELIHKHWKNSTLKIVDGYDHSMRHDDVYEMVKNELK